MARFTSVLNLEALKLLPNNTSSVFPMLSFLDFKLLGESSSTPAAAAAAIATAASLAGGEENKEM